MTMYEAWANSPPDVSIGNAQLRDRVAAARNAVARGQALFNTKPIQIRDVKGLNDALGVATIPGTCTTCHNSPNVGNHSVPLPLDIGIADASRRTPDMPLYTLRHKASGETVQTTDPGRALISGKWNDIGRFKGPILRGLATPSAVLSQWFGQGLERGGGVLRHALRHGLDGRARKPTWSRFCERFDARGATLRSRGSLLRCAFADSATRESVIRFNVGSPPKAQRP